MNRSIRIIGGQFRGKKLQFPDIEGLRPTPDRIRETLFNWLMQDIRDARCLDAFAGSGALGFEAYSRGAAKIVLLEQNHIAYRNLAKLVEGFNSPKLVVRNIDACQYLRQEHESFDIIFLDPPYAKNLLPQCIELLTQSTVLKPKGLLYIESAQTLDLNKTFWTQIKFKKAGQVYYGLYEKYAI